jgi:hypothetical protein
MVSELRNAFQEHSLIRPCAACQRRIRVAELREDWLMLRRLAAALPWSR